MNRLFMMMADWTVWNYITSAIDIAILVFVFYKLLLLLRGTRAMQLLKGILILFVVFFLSDLLGLSAVQWILNQLWAVLFIAMAVIFQPELRRALEKIGRGGLFSSRSGSLSSGDVTHVIEEVIAAMIACAKTKTGALIAIERSTGLSDYVENGISLDAKVSRALLSNIFVKDTPLHDGATIIRNGRIAAAACFLPLSDNPYISMSLGTRHRAGIGLSEVSDAVVLIVSEENGSISVAQDGKLMRHLDERQLRDLLAGQLKETTSASSFLPKGADDSEAK